MVKQSQISNSSKPGQCQGYWGKYASRHWETTLMVNADKQVAIYSRNYEITDTSV